MSNVINRGSILQIVDCDKLIWKQVTLKYCTKGNLLLESSVLFVCLICFFTSHKQSFSYVGTGLPGLKQ